MPETLLSPRNLAFELYEVLDAEALTQRPRFAEHNRETFDAALSTARTIAEKFFAPHNRKADENEPRYVDGRAELIPEVKPAVDAFLEAGFLNANRDFEVGGMQLPSWSHRPASPTSSRQRRHHGLPVPDHGRGQPDREFRQRRTEAPVPPADDRRPLLRHHGPDRTPRRLVTGRYPHPRRTRQ